MCHGAFSRGKLCDSALDCACGNVDVNWGWGTEGKVVRDRHVGVLEGQAEPIEGMIAGMIEGSAWGESVGMLGKKVVNRATAALVTC